MDGPGPGSPQSTGPSAGIAGSGTASSASTAKPSWPRRPTWDELRLRGVEIDRLIKAEMKDCLKDNEGLSPAIAECLFCVTIADSRDEDNPLVGVSEQFQVMTEYRHEEMIGKNCRFLNHGCAIPPDHVAGLRRTCRTGCAFTAMLQNRRKSGELFLNLVDLRGLTIAQNRSTGEELWLIVGIQADVSRVWASRPHEHLADLRVATRRLRERFATEFAELGAMGLLFAQAQEKAPPLGSGGRWDLLETPSWRQGDYPSEMPSRVDDDSGM